MTPTGWWTSDTTPLPITGWWAETHVGASISVAPLVSAAAGVHTGSSVVAIHATPAVSTVLAALEFATTSTTVTPSVSAVAAVQIPAGGFATITPSVSVAATLVKPISVAVIVPPSLSTATSDDSSINITVAPSVSVAAVVYQVGAVASTVTPSVSVAAQVIERSPVAVTVTPSVSAAGATVEHGAVATTVTPSISVAAQLVKAGTAAITTTPSISTAGSVSTGLSYNATGGGTAPATTATTFTWSHSATSGAYVLVFVAVYSGSTVSTVKYGTTSMTSLGSVTDGGSDKHYVYGLAGVASGSQTVTVTLSSANYCAANSISFTGVASAGTPATTTFTSLVTSYSQAVTCTAGQMIVQSFQNIYGADISAYSGGTGRYLGNYGGTSGEGELTISNATASTTFTATLPNGGTGVAYGSGISVVLS